MQLPELSELYNLFDFPDYEKWESQVSKSLESKLDLPFASKERSGYDITSVSNTETGAVIEVGKNLKQLNEEILYLLSQGIQAFEISFDIQLTESVLSTLLKGVITDYIFLFWNVDSQQSKIIHQYSLREGLNISRQVFLNSKKYIKVGKGTLQSPLEIFDSNNIQIYFEVQIDTSYLSEIARLRAIRYQIESNYPDIDYQIIVKYLPNQDFDQDTRKIANTTLAMTSIIGGASVVYPYSTQVDKEEVRIASNGIQVLKFESKLELVNDPLAGAYLIEELTEHHLSNSNIQS